MSPELIGILSVGAAMLIGLGGVVSVNVALYRGLRSDMAALRSELKAEIASTRSELKAEIDAAREDTKALEARVAGLDQGQARLTGAVEGLLAGMGRTHPGRESESAA
ncbi:MAG: hypothetical protein OXR64_15460 [Chloroflexota bacterium]|nr:hypothetical protein [Chloroflexota bacterium]MDE2921234.1 hypothetical protein [Chloroflexota bacterium]